MMTAMYNKIYNRLARCRESLCNLRPSVRHDVYVEVLESSITELEKLMDNASAILETAQGSRSNIQRVSMPKKARTFKKERWNFHSLTVGESRFYEFVSVKKITAAASAHSLRHGVRLKVRRQIDGTIVVKRVY